jgi:hypothetical protein
MEVHHHSTTKHKWTHYLWEFLMLFLAVTIGFYAENMRENYKHHHEARTNMHSLLSDLEADVQMFDSVIDRNDYSIAMADSLVESLHSNPGRTANIYYYARAVTANIGYYFANFKSFDQMKSANLLRLVHPHNLLDSIGSYYVAYQWLDNQIDLLKMKLDQIHKGNIDLFDAYVFDQMMKFQSANYRDLHHIIINRPSGNPKLLTTDPMKINAVSMNYHYYLTTSRFNRATAVRLRGLALRLIKWIREEYDWKT